MPEYVSCPACGSTDVKKLRYTLRGGLWTPLLNFVKCRSCGAQYHGRTGQLNPEVPKAIRAVSVIIIMCFLGFVIGLVLMLSPGRP